MRDLIETLQLYLYGLRNRYCAVIVRLLAVRSGLGLENLPRQPLSRSNRLLTINILLPLSLLFSQSPFRHSLPKGVRVIQSVCVSNSRNIRRRVSLPKKIGNVRPERNYWYTTDGTHVQCRDCPRSIPITMRWKEGGGGRGKGNGSVMIRCDAAGRKEARILERARNAR